MYIFVPSPFSPHSSPSAARNILKRSPTFIVPMTAPPIPASKRPLRPWCQAIIIICGFPLGTAMGSCVVSSLLVKEDHTPRKKPMAGGNALCRCGGQCTPGSGCNSPPLRRREVLSLNAYINTQPVAEARSIGKLAVEA